MPDLVTVAAQSVQRLFFADPAQGQDERRRDPQVGRHAHLAHGDRHARKVGVMHLAPLQDFGQGPPDHLAHAQHALRRGLAIALCILCHALHLIAVDDKAKQGFAPGAKRR